VQTDVCYKILSKFCCESVLLGCLSHCVSQAGLIAVINKGWQLRWDVRGIIQLIQSVFVNVVVPKSQPIAYAQLAFYLHHLGDTDAVTATIRVSAVCWINSLTVLICNRHKHCYDIWCDIHCLLEKRCHFIFGYNSSCYHWKREWILYNPM